MLTIRLKSEGKKHQKTMRIVVIDSRKSSVSNNYIEKIGWWIPAEHKHAINKEKALHWIAMGAKPSVTVHNLFIEDKIIEGNKIPKHNHSEKSLEAKNKKEELVETKESIKQEEAKPEPVEVKEEAKEEVKPEPVEAKEEPEPVAEVKEEIVEEVKAEEAAEEKTEEVTE